MSISDTSALVLLWMQDSVHTSRRAKAYLESLNLESGRELYKKCSSVWPHYGEVIKNRKGCILDMAMRLTGSGKIRQLVIFGAGFDALSVEISQHAGELGIYEVDISNMDLKERLVRKACGRTRSRIRCLNADMRNPQKLLELLEKSGWNRNEPSLLLVEGVSYYLARKELHDLICMFKMNGRNRMILEYLLPRDCISGDRAHIPEEIFSLIRDRYGLPLSRYDERSIRELLGPDCRIGRILNLKEMEIARTGRNTHFKTANSGWIQVCEISL